MCLCTRGLARGGRRRDEHGLGLVSKTHLAVAEFGAALKPARSEGCDKGGDDLLGDRDTDELASHDEFSQWTGGRVSGLGGRDGITGLGHL